MRKTTYSWRKTAGQKTAIGGENSNAVEIGRGKIISAAGNIAGLVRI
jgi:hypothetical protein